MGGRDGSALPGAWPTTLVGAGENSHGQISGDFRNRMEEILTGPRWATPDCNTSTYSNGRMGPNIREQASQWLTPNVPNVPNGGRSVSAELVHSKGMDENGEKRTVGLESQTRHWGTPQARDYRSPDSPNYQRKLAEGYSIDLNSQAANWANQEPAEASARPTPRATDGTKGGPNQAGSKGDLMLPSAAAQFSPVSAWPTPASRDYRTPNLESLEARGGGSKGEQLPNFVEHHFSPPDPATPSGATTSARVVSVSGGELSPTTKPVHVLGRLRLNPAFGCWLMGWPSWWTNPGITNSVRSEMVSCRCALQWHLSNYCAAPALRGEA